MQKFPETYSTVSSFTDNLLSTDMARTKQSTWESPGGKALRKQLATKAASCVVDTSGIFHGVF